jgi:hypothetical protein
MLKGESMLHVMPAERSSEQYHDCEYINIPACSCKIFERNKHFYEKTARKIKCHYGLFYARRCLFERRHDKTNIMGLRPAWIQTSLRIRAV